MIWSNGKILPDDGLTIPISDRTFEHGLGLFETFRTYNGRATLLERHKARLLRSATELDLPIDPSSLPHEQDVRRLLEAEGITGDRMLRITASGGTASTNSIVWMKSSPLPEPVGEGGASLLVNSWEVDSKDTLARHKTLNYWERRRVFEEARRQGFDEALSGNWDQNHDSYYYYEGSRTNFFLMVADTRGLLSFQPKRPTIYTSSTASPIVPGIMRQVVIELARELSAEVREQKPGIESGWAGRSTFEVFLTNSVRGIIPVGRVTDASKKRVYRYEAPGRLTRMLQEQLEKRLRLGLQL